MNLTPRPLGSTGLSVTPICVGGSEFGNMPAAFGYDVPEDRGRALVLVERRRDGADRPG